MVSDIITFLGHAAYRKILTYALDMTHPQVGHRLPKPQLVDPRL